MLFNEPKLLKSSGLWCSAILIWRFSALQRAEIAEMQDGLSVARLDARFSALQRAEIAEIVYASSATPSGCVSFSALQRAEIAEIYEYPGRSARKQQVSVLFNEPKLLKW